MTRIVVFLAVAFTCCNLVFADVSLKPYSPFDEPKPRIPNEIIEDKRLDVEVNVFVKSKSFRDLFAEITKQTGIKLTCEREIAAERAIIYFHARPLRDVMTELSGLFGYYWLPKGKEGNYRYELREDSRHAKRREEVDKQRADELNALFVRFTDKVIKEPAVLDRLLEDSPKRAWGPSRTLYYKGVPDLLSALGMERIQDLAWASESGVLPWEDLPPALKEGILAWVNAFGEYRRQAAVEGGRDPSYIGNYGMADLQQCEFRYNPFRGSSSSMPHFALRVRKLDRSGSIGWTSWPPFLNSEDELRKAMGDPVRDTLLLEKPLPDKCEITVSKARFSRHGEGCVSLGDVTEAIAKSAEIDVIADYYLQDLDFYNTHLYFLDPVEKQTLSKVLGTIQDSLDYACRFDGLTLRLRYYPWFSRKLVPEPPSALIEKCWQELEKKGALSLETMTEIACMPDEQLEWGGFEFMPQAQEAWMSSTSLRMRRVVRPRMLSIAESEAGLPVGSLNREQFDELFDWAKEYKDDIQPADLSQGIIHIAYTNGSEDAGGSFWRFSVTLQGEVIEGNKVFLSCSLSRERLKEVTAQRKADAEADKVEVVK